MKNSVVRDRQIPNAGIESEPDFMKKDTLRVRAHAKINLYLNVLGKRDDGYHELETIFHSIALHDDVIIRLSDAKKITVRCAHPGVPNDARNLAYRAAQCLSDAVGGMGGVAIDIYKRIPVAAGLAGGSANAAAVLHGINQLYGCGFTQTELMQMGVGLGADVPFCLHGGAAFGRGIGEVLTPLPALSDTPILLLNPGIAVATANIFKKLHFFLTNGEKCSIIIETFVKKGELVGIGANLYNRLEMPAFIAHPEIAALKSQLSTQADCHGALMTGSGATVFGLMQDIAAAERSASRFQNNVAFCTTTTTSAVGVHIDS